jgi:hypothetical protein
LTFAVLATTSVMLLVPLAAEEAQEAPPPVSVMLIAARATHQGHEVRQFDKSILSISETVKDLKQFDDFRKLRAVKTVAPYGKETKIPLDKQYIMLLKPIERASHNRIRCSIQVKMRLEEKEDEKEPESQGDSAKEKPKYKEVLRCTLLAVSGKPFKVTGLKLDEGQMVLVLTLTEKRPEEGP